MAIITQKESFLLKFKQENSQVGSNPLEISVTKSSNDYVIEIRSDKKNLIKTDLDSLREIINYIDSKINFTKPVVKNSSSFEDLIGNKEAERYLKISGNSNITFNNNQGANGPSQIESVTQSSSDDVGDYSDLLKDIEKNSTNSMPGGLYNSQADVILSNAIDMSSLTD
jgi:hypothetical protein